MLTAEQINIATTAASEISDMTVLTRNFYGILFANHPDVRTMFPNDISEQATKLAETLKFAFGKLNDLDTLVPALQKLGVAHKNYGVHADHYSAVATSLMQAIEKELGPKFDQQTQDTLGAILTLVASVMQDAANASAQRH